MRCLDRQRRFTSRIEALGIFNKIFFLIFMTSLFPLQTANASQNYDLSGNAQVLWNTTPLQDIRFGYSPNIDFDMDGSRDIIVLNYTRLNLISGLDGTEKWNRVVWDNIGGMSNGIVTDVEGDGGNEFFVSKFNLTNGYFGILKGKTGATLWEKNSYLSPGDSLWAYPTDFGDISGDAKNDLIIINELYNNINRIYNYNLTAVRGFDGSELWERSYRSLQNDWLSVYPDIIDDINRDSKRDLLVNIYKGPFSDIEAVSGVTGSIIWNSSDSWGLSAYDDLNGDGYDDVILSSMGETWAARGYDGVRIWPQNAYGYLITPFQNINGDGRADVIVGSRNYLSGFGEVRALSGADGTIIWNKPLGVPGWPDGSSIKDVDGDGKRDLFIITRNETLINNEYYFDYYVQVISGANGNILWSQPYNNKYLNGYAWFDIPGDLTGDGKQDIYLWIEYRESNQIWQYLENTTAIDAVNGNRLWDLNRITYDNEPHFLGDFDGNYKGDVLIFSSQYSVSGNSGFQSIEDSSNTEERTRFIKRKLGIQSSNLDPQFKNQLIERSINQNSVSNIRLINENDLMSISSYNARAFTGDNIASTIWNISSINNMQGVYSPRNIDMNADGFVDKAIIIGNSIYLIEKNVPSPPKSVSISINNGAEVTYSTSVSLKLSAENAFDMRFSNDDVIWSAWEPFGTAKQWELSSGDGLKTVYFEVRNNVGTSKVSDSITFDSNAPISSCTIITSPGSYKLTNDILDNDSAICLNITSDNIIINGNNHIIDGKDIGSSIGVYLKGRSSVTIKNLNIKDWGTGIILEDSSNINTVDNNNISSNERGIRVFGSHYNTLNNNFVSFNNKTGIKLDIGSSHNIIMGNNASNNDVGGIALDGGSNNNTVENNRAYSNNFEGIYVNASNDNTIKKNLALLNNVAGIWIEHSDRNKVEDNTVNSNIKGDGIFIVDFSTNNQIHNNTINSNGWAGIVLKDSSSNNNISNNNLTNNGISSEITSMTKAGILIRGNSNLNNVFNNRIENNEGGIRIFGSHFNILEMNTIRDDNLTGIKLDESSTHNDVIKNIAENSKNGSGIVLGNGSNNNSLYNNTVRFNRNQGIMLYSSSNDNVIANNTASLNVAGGIMIDGSGRNRLSGNRVTSNFDYGVYMLNSGGNVIFNNIFNNSDNYWSLNNLRNEWNITKTTGTNIIGGPHLGGNLWNKPNGMGYSQICKDDNNDWLCDLPLILDQTNREEFSLIDPSRPEPARPSSLSILINGGKSHTNSTLVTLTLSANLAENMSFNNSGDAWSPWEPFNTTKLWTLQSGDGLKTVYFKANNAIGEANPVSDSIILDTQAPKINSVFINDTMMKLGDAFYGEVNATDNLEPNLTVVVHVINSSGVEVTSMNLPQTGIDIYKLEGRVGENTPEGTYRLNITASDDAGNTAYNNALSLTIDRTKPIVTNFSSDKSYINNKWNPGTINPPVKIIANVTDNFGLQEVTVAIVDNQTGIIPFIWNITGRSVGNTYNYSWNGSQWEISNETKNIYSAIIFNIESPDRNLSALGHHLLAAQGKIIIDSSSGEQTGFVIFDNNGTMHLVGSENKEPYYISPELLNLSCNCNADYEYYKSHNMTLVKNISTFVPMAFVVNLNQGGIPQSISLENLTFSGRPEDHFNFSLKQIPAAEGEYLIALHVVDKAGNENEIESLNVKIDNSPPIANITIPLNNSELKFTEDLVRGEVLDTNLNSAKLFVRNETQAIIKQYDLLLVNNKFMERVEYAPDQNNTLELNAIDKAGNTNLTSLQVFIKNNSNQTTVDVNSSVPVKIDAKNETDTEIEFISNINQTGVTVTITAITNGTQILNLNNTAFALSKEMAVGRIVEVNLTGLDATNESEVQSVIIKMFYNIADLDLNGDGILGAGDLDENNIFIYWLNTTDGNWTKLLENNPTWVIKEDRVKISGTTPGNVWVKVRHLSTFGLVAGLVPEPIGGGPIYYPSSGGGGGGGGGGGTSGENYSNIILKEKYDEMIYKDKVTSYTFKNESNPIRFVNITGNVSAGVITTMAEVLKGTSTLVKENAPGIVYKNANLWVGTSGFAVPRNIKESTIMFRVENSWLESNALVPSEIKLVKWESGKWITLETSEKMRDSSYTYFEGKTTSFSPFAITGIKGVSAVSASPTAVQPGTTITGTPASTSVQEGQPVVNLTLILGVLIFLIAIGAVAYLMKKK